jgi:hypothetical protein
VGFVKSKRRPRRRRKIIKTSFLLKKIVYCEDDIRKQWMRGNTYSGVELLLNRAPVLPHADDDSNSIIVAEEGAETRDHSWWRHWAKPQRICYRESLASGEENIESLGQGLGITWPIQSSIMPSWPSRAL